MFVIQDPSPKAAPSRSDEIAVSLTELVGPLRRRWRLILFGIGACWALLLLYVLLAPPRYRCDASLALPSLIPPTKTDSDVVVSLGLAPPSAGALEAAPSRDQEPWEEGTEAGLPYAFYYKLERSLRDGEVLQSSLGQTLDPATLEGLRGALTGHVSAVATETGDDKDKKKDVVGAVDIFYVSDSADRSRRVVSALATLLRHEVITGLAREKIAWEVRASDRARLSLIRRKEELLEANRSLEKLAADLERLAREVPTGRTDAPREVVDTREGGHLYLPPWLQLVGVKARYATNEHLIRTYDEALARHALRLSFLRRLDQRLEGAGAPIGSDLPRIIAEALKEVTREQGSSGAVSGTLEAEMQALGDQMSVFATQTRFIQHPTVGPVSRVAWVGALASLAVVFFVAAAFVADLWQRSAEERTDDDAAPRQSP
jgi:hypothetical protein